MTHKHSLDYVDALLKQSMHANNRAMRVLEASSPSINFPDQKAQIRLARMSLKAARSFAEDALNHIKIAEDILKKESHGEGTD